ncbi:MAG: tRNA (guanosine(46)-N7)-methyltransferase TrmB [Bacilli bacterium]|nr:tRNA (guanosine(46)-N7)-methyltransferase TrmB [Bacilli bacterium]
MRTKFKPWAEPYINEHPEVMCPFDKLNEEAPCYLEIGSGKGQFLVDMASKFPNEKFIGVERNVTCAGITAKKLVENKVANAKLIFADAQQITAAVNDNSIDGIFLNFSDPWPKKRHHKRRLTSESFISEYYRILKKGSRLIFKTDNYDLFTYSIEIVSASSFKLVEANYSYDGSDDFDAITEYEANFRSQNLPIYRLILEKL